VGIPCCSRARASLLSLSFSLERCCSVQMCLCLEVTCCHNLAVSASRQYTMDAYHLHSDSCDRRLIRCNNCLQCFACICTIVSAITGVCKGGAECLRHVCNCCVCCASWLVC
jgi:hypothetical protein